MFDKISKFMTQYFTLFIILFATVAFCVPEPLKGHGDAVSWLLGIIMLSMGLTMTPSDFKLVFTRPKDVFFGVIVLYICMPIVGMGLGRIFGLSPMLAVGLILVGCTPTGTTSNVMTFLAKGDTALTVTISSVNTLLAPLLTPLLLMIYAGAYLQINGSGLFLSILQIVFVPILFGFLIRKCFKRFLPLILKIVPMTSMVAMMSLISIIVALNVDKLADAALLAILACLCYTAIGLSVGYGSSRILNMDVTKRKSFSFIIGVQNTALAATLGVQYFDPVAAIPGAVLAVWASVFCSFVAGVWNKRSEKSQKILKHVVSESSV